MAVMYVFCRYFSVRLGSILVAVFSMIQSTISTGFLLWVLNDLNFVSKEINELTPEFNLIYVTNVFYSIQENPEIYLKSSIVFFMFHIGACVLLIYAAVKCNVPLIWLFLVVEFVRLAFLFFVHVTAMMIIKENSLELGLLILLCLFGSFTLLGLYYMWFCVVSLCQCIKEFKENGTKRKQPDTLDYANMLASEFKHITKINYNLFPTSGGLQTVYSLRNRDYHYGNMSRPTY